MRALLFAVRLLSQAASGQELRVLSGGAAKAFIDPLAASFTAAGDPADMVVVTSEVPPEAFRQALPAAKSVVYIDPKIGTGGKHVVAPVGRGEVELGIQHLTGPQAKDRLAQAGYTTPQ
ncbi:MAG: hypothetical protein ACT4P4_11015 [Betaproteobacteria bacterium]